MCLIITEDLYFFALCVCPKRVKCLQSIFNNITIGSIATTSSSSVRSLFQKKKRWMRYLYIYPMPGPLGYILIKGTVARLIQSLFPITNICVLEKISTGACNIHALINNFCVMKDITRGRSVISEINVTKMQQAASLSGNLEEVSCKG